MNNNAVSGKNILIVDDDISSVIYASYILKKAGARVHSVNNGEQAVRKTLDEDMDIILMDLKMQFMDGYETTRQIRANGKTMPILAYTACVLSDEKDRCLEAGCNDYIIKPILPKELLQKVSDYLKK
ncbi:MAG: response regulator [Candidatus Woesearchaeota archaeon]